MLHCSACPAVCLTQCSRCSVLLPDPFFICVGMIPSPPAFVNLLWLRKPERVRFKVAMLVYCCLHGIASQYLTAALYRTAEVDSRRWPQSADSEPLIAPWSRLVTMDNYSFSVTEPRVWNILSLTIRSTQSLASFKSQLKTFPVWQRVGRILPRPRPACRKRRLMAIPLLMYS
jgi:hypothetical protein